jgi:FAD dependent oxidoreductase TIGR03364
MENRSAIVIGAGSAGIATARALAEKGFKVKVFERNHKAVGASVRNFGMIWPIGQPSGKLYERALQSKRIWKQVCTEANIWHNECGSIHLAHSADEWQVLQELQECYGHERAFTLLHKDQVEECCPAAQPNALEGGLYSQDEMLVDARNAIEQLPLYLSEKYRIQFFWGKCVTYISNGTAYIGNEEMHEADLIFICSGTDFETLYPEVFLQLPLTKCKLQMMRLQQQPEGWQIGPALCGGLSLIHYKSFAVASSLQKLQQRYHTEMSGYTDWGIHVMVAQNERGELTIGDSHEYGNTHDPFDKEVINKLIIDYLQKIARFKNWDVKESWNGIYPKLTNGDTEIFLCPEPGVYILNGFGGAGMTLSFGYAEEVINDLCK